MQRAAPPSSPRRRLAHCKTIAEVVAWILIVAGMGSAVAAPVLAPTSSAPAQTAPGAKAASARSNASRPHWRDLDVEQQQALSPLASHWDGLSETQKRKWLVISRNQATLSPAERAVQHSRMTEWVGLSRQQREQARFNFDEVKQVPAAERKAKWEAYQALSAEEKQRLAESAAKRPQGAARTIRPVPAQKLAPVPMSQGGRPGPRIELAPQAPTAGPARAVPRPAPATGEPATVPPGDAPVVPLLPN